MPHNMELTCWGDNRWGQTDIPIAIHFDAKEKDDINTKTNTIQDQKDDQSINSDLSNSEDINNINPDY